MGSPHLWGTDLLGARANRCMWHRSQFFGHDGTVLGNMPDLAAQCLTMRKKHWHKGLPPGGVSLASAAHARGHRRRGHGRGGHSRGNTAAGNTAAGDMRSGTCGWICRRVGGLCVAVTGWSLVIPRKFRPAPVPRPARVGFSRQLYDTAAPPEAAAERASQPEAAAERARQRVRYGGSGGGEGTCT